MAVEGEDVGVTVPPAKGKRGKKVKHKGEYTALNTV